MQLSNLACSGRSRSGRLMAPFFVLAALLAIGCKPMWAGPATTIVTDVIYRADGTPAAGTMLISWPAFSTVDGKPVAAGNMSLSVGSGGNVMLALAPNEGANPAGTYYKVVLKLDDGTTSTEYWVIPRKSPVKVSEVRSTIVPASVAVQMASRQYVDTTLVGKADDNAVIHKMGDETVPGLKQFSSSPLVPNPTVAEAAANKGYVDNAIASLGANDYLRKSGDSMNGPLILADDPTSANQAVNRHYVDLQTTTLGSAMGQKLARQGDTPITLAGIRYASQFPSIQAAITDAGSKGTVLIPSDYAGTDTFTNPNKIPVIDLRGDASAMRGTYNVRDFGATPDDGSDDWAAIQAAIDAASAGSAPFGAVYVPKGIYTVSKPLHITRGIKFFGAGRNVTTITGNSADQGAVMVVSPPVSAGYAGLPTGTALATGSGTSIYLNGTSNYYLNLREGGAVELSGRTALTIEFYYKPNFTNTVGDYNIVSSSGGITGNDSNIAFAVMHGNSDVIKAQMNIGGTDRTVTSPANRLHSGTTVHVAVTYDGSVLRLFVNGALQGSTPATGTIVQRMSEDVILGPREGDFLESAFFAPMVNGWVDSLRISASARYTTSFTAPSAKLANDGDTMFLLNFDDNYDQFTVAKTMYGDAHLFLRRLGGGLGQVGNFQLSDLSFIGTGPEFIYTILSLVDNVQINAYRRGLHLINDCFMNRLTSVRVVGGAATQFDLGIGPQSGVLTLTDISLAGGHFSFYQNNSSMAVHGLWVEMTSGTEIGAVFKGTLNSTAVVNNMVLNTEAAPETLRYALAEVGMGSLVLNGGVLETYNSRPHVGIFGGTAMVHVGANYAGSSAPASIYQIVNPPATPIQLIGPLQQNMNVPWADNLNWIQSSTVKTNQGCSGNDKVTGISSTGTLVCGSSTGYTLTLANDAANAPLNASTYYFGGNIVEYNNTNFDAAKIDVPKSGTVRRIFIRQNISSGSPASPESVIHKVCINSASNCFGAAEFAYDGTSTSGIDVAINQPVTAGDTIAVRVDTPSWATRPTNVRWYATLYIE